MAKQDLNQAAAEQVQSDDPQLGHPPEDATPPGSRPPLESAQRWEGHPLGKSDVPGLLSDKVAEVEHAQHYNMSKPVDHRAPDAFGPDFDHDNSAKEVAGSSDVE